MAILRWLVSAILAPLLDGLAAILRDRQANADAKALGAAQQKSVDQAAGIEAGKVIQDAQAQPKGRDVTQGALDAGKF